MYLPGWKLVDDMSDEIAATGEKAGALKAQVYALVQACPAGKVTTYGWIATQ